MPTESLAKREVTSGVIQFEVGPEGLVRIVVPVAESKKDEAVPMMDELYNVAMRHYKMAHKLNPRDVANALRKIGDAFEQYQLSITEDKYNAKTRKPRTTT